MIIISAILAARAGVGVPQADDSRQAQHGVLRLRERGASIVWYSMVW